jgi:acetoin utilization protein AcuB
MLVRERMNKHPLTVKADAPVDGTLRRMKDEKVRRFPVVNDHGRLIGIVTETDLLYAAPSPATSLSVYEMHYLYSRIRVKEVMTRKVLTVQQDVPIEEAARLMIDNKIGGLPVMRDDDLVGIITETDIFRAFMEMLGARDEGVRITVLCEDRRGELAKLGNAVTEMGGNIVSIGTFWGEDAKSAYIVMKVAGIEKDALVANVTDKVLKIVDVRED